jgi:hypothetical protein
MAFKLLEKFTDNYIQEFLTLFSEELLEELNLIKEDIAEDLKYLYKNRDEINSDLSNSYKMIEEFGAGLNCSICETRNHLNFIYSDQDQEYKMVFDFNYCYSLFKSKELGSVLDFMKHMQYINTLNTLLSTIYEVDMLENLGEAEDNIEMADKMRLSCLASVDDSSDDEECAEMCLEIGSPNKLFWKYILTPLTTFALLITDYFNGQEFLNHKENAGDLDAAGDYTEKMIEKFVDEWDLDYLLPVTKSTEELNLSEMKIDLAEGKGWNFYDIRMRDWGVYQESVGLFGNVFVLGFFICSLGLL